MTSLLVTVFVDLFYKPLNSPLHGCEDISISIAVLVDRKGVVGFTRTESHLSRIAVLITNDLESTIGTLHFGHSFGCSSSSRPLAMALRAPDMKRAWERVSGAYPAWDPINPTLSTKVLSS